MGFTARQVSDMAAHLRACEVCGDDELRAGLDEGLPVEELSDAVATAHDPVWQRFLVKHGETENAHV